MKTLHSVNGVTSHQAEGFEHMRALVLNKIELYNLDIPWLYVNEITDAIAKIAHIQSNKDLVVCSSDRTLGTVGISLIGGIKRAFNTDVWSTYEERQAVSLDTELKLDTHLVSDLYPEYWVSDSFIQYVWVKNSSAEFISAMSQMVGLILGLNVVEYN